MHLDNKKTPLLVPLLEPVALHATLRRGRNLLPWSMASQYSTATAATCAGCGNGPRAAGPQGGRNAAANGLHADEHAVKPHDIRRNRTSSAASAAGAGRVHSNQGASRGFFPNPPPPDGPRQPRAAAGPLPAADAHALDNGTIVGDGAPCPARWPDTADLPAAATRAVPLGHSLRYSTVRADDGEKTTSRIPSRDKSAPERGQGLAVAAKSNHAGQGPRERQLPKVKPRQRSFYSAPGRL